MSRVKKLLYSIAAGLAAALFALYTAGGQPGEYKASLSTALPPEKVLPYLTEPDLIKQWMPAIVSSTPLTTGGVRQGAKSREVIEADGQRLVAETEIIELIPNRILTVRITMENIEAISFFRFVPGGLAHTQQVLYKGYLRPLSPFLHTVGQRQLDTDFQRVKTLLGQ